MTPSRNIAPADREMKMVVTCSPMSQPERTAWEQEFLRLEREIRQSDGGGLRLRWQMGHVMLKCRAGRRLPNGYLDLWSEGLHVHPSELTARMKFAEKFPTEAELTNIISRFTSWYDIKQHVLTDTPRGKKPNVSLVIQHALKAFEKLSITRLVLLPYEHRLLRRLHDIIEDLMRMDETAAQYDETADDARLEARM